MPIDEVACTIFSRMGLCFEKLIQGLLLSRHDQVSSDVCQDATQEQNFVLNLLQHGRAEQDEERFKKYMEYDYSIMCE